MERPGAGRRVAVVGAGAAGLAAARHLAASRYNFQVFEQAGEVGGTWIYTERVGQDDFGLPVHSSMYRSLRTNLPKEVMGYPDFPIPEQEKSYIPAKDILQFLNDYADHFDVRKHIQFHHHVKHVSPAAGGGWKVVVVDLKSQEERSLEFDAVMVCNGHYSTPYIPTIPGCDRFRGVQLHSHDYRIPDVFRGKKVLVVGAGPSGMDLTLEIATEAEQVVMSHHLATPIATIFPDNVLQKPDVTLLSEGTASFQDGTSMDVDVIFYCTGYKYNFPFLSASCGVRVEDNFVQPLYKHLIHIEHPTLCLVGLPFYVCAFSMFDLQIRFFLKTLDGSVPLPSKEDMLRDTEDDMAKRREAGFSRRQAHMMGPLQGDYYNDLATTAGIPGLPTVFTKLHNASSQRFLDDLVNYRQDIYKIVDNDSFVQVK